MADKKSVDYKIAAEDGFTAAFDKLKSKITDTESHFEHLKGMVAGAFAGFSAAGMVEMVKSVVEAGDEALKMAQKVGIGVEAWQQLAYAAKLSNVDQEALGKGIKTLSVNLLAAADNSTKAQDMFSRLGISIKDVNGNVKPTEQILLDLAERFKTMPDGMQKTAIATQVFGKAGMELIPMLNQGRAGMEDLMKEAVRLGLVMDDKTAASAESLNDNLTRLTAASRGVVIQGVAPLIPFMEKMSAAMVKSRTEGDRLADSSKILETGLKLVGSVVLIMKGTFESLGQLIGGVAAALVQLFSGQFAAAWATTKQTFADVATVADKNKKVLGELWNGVADNAEHAAVKTRGLGAATDDAAKKSENAYKSELANLDKEIAKLKGVGEMDAYIMKLDEERFANLTPKQRQMLIDKEQELLNYQHEKEIKQAILASDKLLLEAEQKLFDLRRDYTLSLNDQIAQEKFDLELIGKTSVEAERLTKFRQMDLDLKRQIEQLPQDELGYDVKVAEQLQLQNDRAKEKIGLYIDAKARALDELNVLAQQTALWTEIADRGSQFFTDLVTHGQSAFGRLKEMLKQFLSEMIALFAKRWILQLGASATGSSSLSAAANSGFGSSLVGNVGGAAFAGGAEFATAATGSFMGPTMAGTAAGYGTAVYGALAAMGPVGWVIAGVAAIAALAYAFRDKGENWQATLGFGPNAQAYTSTGPFGTQGFQSIQGNDALNTQIQAFMASTIPLDQMLARGMSQSQIDRVTANLGGPYTTRNDGQPSQFAFGKGDDTAAQQLTLEFLQKKYGTIFDEIDTTFAKYIRDYTGKAEDLLKEIIDHAALLDTLSQGVGLRGLDVNALRAFQLQGETLAQTLQRILTTVSQFDDAFMSDAQKLARSQKQVTDTFADLGIAVPESKEAFYNLVHGLDLSTESGRRMFTMLMQVAPAFLDVSNAADQAAAALAASLDSFDQLMGRLRPGYSTSLAGSQLNDAVSQFMGSNQWTHGMSVADFLTQIRTITRDDFSHYSAANQALILHILDLDNTVNGNTVATNTNTQAVITTAPGASASGKSPEEQAFEDFYGTAGRAARDAAANAAAQKLGADTNLNSYLNSLLTGNLSPLAPDAQLEVARQQYQDVLKRAQGGDIAAEGQLQGAGQSYLDLARGAYASSPQFVDIFQRVFSEIAGVAGTKDYNARMEEIQTKQLTEQQSQTTELREIRELLLSIRDGQGDLVDATTDGSDKVASSVAPSTWQPR